MDKRSLPPLLPWLKEPVKLFKVVINLKQEFYGGKCWTSFVTGVLVPPGMFMGGVLKMCAGYRGKCLEGKFNHCVFCDLRYLNDGRHPTTQMA